MNHRRLTFAAACAAATLLASCGGSTEETAPTVASTEAPAPTEAPTTPAPTTPAVTEVVTTEAVTTEAVSTDDGRVGSPAFIGQAMAEGMGLTLDDTQAQCVGDELVAALGGIEGITEMADGPTDEELESVFDSFEACDVSLDGRQPDGSVSPMATQMAEAFASGSGVALSPEQAECLGQGLLDELGGVRGLATIGDEPSPEVIGAVVGVANTCGIDLSELEDSQDDTEIADLTSQDEVLAMFVPILVNGGFGDDTQATCMIESMFETYGDAEALRLVNEENTEEEVVEMTAMAEECGLDPSFLES